MRRTRLPVRSLARRMLLFLTLTALASACGEDGRDLPAVVAPTTEVSELTITPAEASLAPDEDRRFSVEAHDTEGEPATVEVDWSAEGGTIDDDGLFTAGSTSGDFTVTASHRTGLQAEADVTIEDGASGSDDPGDDDGSGDGDGSALADECESPHPEWIWCDDFEVDRLGAYFEYDSDDGDFVRRHAVGVQGSAGMRAIFQAGETSAGNLHLAFGRTPSAYVDPIDDGTAEYRELYWRVYVRNEADWTGGGGNKLSRATSLVSDDWAQPMIAHVWSGSGSESRWFLSLDPASGTDEDGNLLSTEYNDWDNLRWLGSRRSDTPIFDDAYVGKWYCIEAHVRWNDAERSNGVFELWIDGILEASRSELNWVGAYDDYGMNAVFLENHWNAGSPTTQERYFDNFVVSTERIGC